MAQPQPAPTAFPRIPAHAWTWLQRTRPVVVEVAARLTGGAPPAGFVEELRAAVDTDPFARDVLVATVADVAFGGRIPRRRPPGANWDRGLTWWAAALAGVSPDEFEARSRPEPGHQPRLFDGQPQAERAVLWTPAMLAAALRQLLDAADADNVPASAVRQLLVQLDASEEPPAR